MGVEVRNSHLWGERTAGVTLLELLLVLVLLGVVAVTVMPKFLDAERVSSEGDPNGFCRGVGQTHVNCLELFVRDAQAKAMLVAPGYSVVQAPPADHKYKILDETKTRVIAEESFPSNLTITPFDITFDGLGRPSWFGDITFTYFMGDGVPTKTGVLHVEANTGAVWVVQNE